ncbi:MAG: hypothetical protein ACRYGG_18935 [Janthinobacterium lividum]
MSDRTSAPGYAVQSRTLDGRLAIWGIGNTQHEAWASYNYEVGWTKLSVVDTTAVLWPATRRLLDAVDLDGGAIPCRISRGVLCLPDEVEEVRLVA